MGERIKKEKFIERNLAPGKALTVLAIVLVLGILAVGYREYRANAREPVIRTAVMQAVSFFYNIYDQKLRDKIAPESKEKPFTREELEDMQFVAQIDTNEWKSYRNTWYGIEVKYPEDWLYPQPKKALSDNLKYDYKFAFRRAKDDPDSKYQGFDVVVYNTKKAADFSNTDELKKKEGECNVSLKFREMKTGREDYDAHEVYIPDDHSCYGKTYFISLKKDKYLYNIVPVRADEEDTEGDWERETAETFPEFYQSLVNLSFIPIKKKTAVTRLVIPRMTCQHPERKPRKSKTKGRHMDEDCCMDPDEWPNPACRY